jgi:hypothetical protein
MSVMVHGWDFVTCLINLRKVNVGNNEASIFSTVNQRLTPGVNNQRMAKGLPVARMVATLGGGDNITTRFDSTGPL